MSDETPEQKITEYVAEHEGVTFVELQELLEDDIEVEGGHVLDSPVYPNVHFWMNMSERFVEAVENVVHRGDIHMHPCHPFVYAVDGRLPKLDIAKQPPDGGYADDRDRWYPISFCSYPIEERDDDEPEGDQ